MAADPPFLDAACRKAENKPASHTLIKPAEKNEQRIDLAYDRIKAAFEKATKP